MDFYYYLKDEFTCQDCKHPLKLKKKNDHMSYVAECIGCLKQFEVNIDIKLRKEK